MSFIDPAHVYSDERKFIATNVLRNLVKDSSISSFDKTSEVQAIRSDGGKKPSTYFVANEDVVIGVTEKKHALNPMDGSDLLDEYEKKLKKLEEEKEEKELREEEKTLKSSLKEWISELKKLVLIIVHMFVVVGGELRSYMSTGSCMSHLFSVEGEDKEARGEDNFSWKYVIAERNLERRMETVKFSDMISSIKRVVSKKEKEEWGKMEENEKTREKAAEKIREIMSSLKEKVGDFEKRKKIESKQLKKLLGTVPLFLFQKEWENEGGRVYAMIFMYVYRFIHVQKFWTSLCNGILVSNTEVNVFEGKYTPGNDKDLVGVWGVWGDLSVMACNFGGYTMGQCTPLYHNTVRAIDLGYEIAVKSVKNFFETSGGALPNKNLAEVCSRIASKLIMDELNKEEGETPNDNIWASMKKWQPFYCDTDDLRPLIAEKRAEKHAEKRAAETSAEEPPAKCSRVGSI